MKGKARQVSEKKYTEDDATEKLKKIESYIAQYNALSDNKIATIHVSRGGDLKLHGSKYIIDACLHSSVIRDLKNKWREREEVDEEGVDDDEVIFRFVSMISKKFYLRTIAQAY